MSTCYPTRSSSPSYEERLHAFECKQLEQQCVPTGFSKETSSLHEEDLPSVSCLGRQDLRGDRCFTIDCDDTKDMDDAISLSKTVFGYLLLVHIADLAAYVPHSSWLDAEAQLRATSIYLTLQTIPMLPKVLSNILCSLHPGADRLAVTIRIELDNKGDVLSYAIFKSIICSSLKGTYSEVNKFLTGKADVALSAKYAAVGVELFEMKYLAFKLRERRIHDGASVADDKELRININDRLLNITPVQKGDAEHSVEEVMILANRVVAEYFRSHNLPALYRAQAEKGTQAYYTSKECCPHTHAELALENYMHFTAPVRRFADLVNHQILSAHLRGMDSATIRSVFDDETLADLAEQVTRKSRRADNIERACQRYCIRMLVESQPDKLYPARMIGHDPRNHLPIIEIPQFRVRVYGSFGLRATIGDILTCSLKHHPDPNTNRLIGVNIRHRSFAAAA